MEITGKIAHILPEVSGQGRNGVWRKQEFILETTAQYPKKICMSLWGEKIEQFKLVAGETVQASFDVESREYNGRWYTEVKAWKITRGQSGGAEPPIYPTAEEFTTAPAQDNDLPF